jgi:hypothetical protein
VTDRDKPAEIGVATKRMPEGRLKIIENMLAACVPGVIIERRMSTEWRISTRQVRRYVQRVLERWAEQAKVVAPLRRYQLRVMMEDIYSKAREGNELGIAITAADRLARLDGGYEPVEIKHTGEVRLPSGFQSPADARAYLATHMKRLAQEGMHESSAEGAAGSAQGSEEGR